MTTTREGQRRQKVRAEKAGSQGEATTVRGAEGCGVRPAGGWPVVRLTQPAALPSFQQNPGWLGR